MEQRALLVTETVHDGHDISTVYAYLAGVGGPKCDMFSCFNGQYKRGEEHAFIEQLDMNNPGKYYRFLISWVGSN